jgi:hypothetical protein
MSVEFARTGDFSRKVAPSGKFSERAFCHPQVKTSGSRPDSGPGTDFCNVNVFQRPVIMVSRDNLIHEFFA